eukprot:TRINITY_DN303_c0_g1_i1.p1 TRINITY_DN303_c0_g1~~TRINITY_DN303_c0_g1_i1.p1  ORF type:complete len:326 (-),score=41.68 TRINITY_DN303_c0_g1_i1:229-1206(-)
MDCVFFVAVWFVTGVASQSELYIIAAGEIPDRSYGLAVGVAQGEEVQGEAIVAVDDTSAFAQAYVVASGESSYDTYTAPTHSSNQNPQPIYVASYTPEYVTHFYPQFPTTAVVQPDPIVYIEEVKKQIPEPTCADIYDDMCPAISMFNDCGYCILQKYPLQGYGCPVEKIYVEKDDHYEMVKVPGYDCVEGALYIDDVTYCPSCDLALKELLFCTGIKEVSNNISEFEIEASCLEVVQVTIEYLCECGFIQVAEEYETWMDSDKYITVHLADIGSTAVATTESASVVGHDTIAIAGADASTTTAGTGGVAIASASAYATSAFGKH